MQDLVTWATPITDGVLSWFVESTIVAAVLAALAVLGARIRWLAPGPAMRHVLWLMVLVKLVTPPLVHWPWSVPSPVAQIRLGSTRAVEQTVRSIAPANAIESELASRDELEPGDESLFPPDDDEARPTAEASASEPKLVVEADQTTAPTWSALSRSLGILVVLAWFLGSIVLFARQARRVIQFRRLLVEATPAPEWLVEEARAVGRRLMVGVPEILVVPRLATPLLWCLGRPVLLVPVSLLKTLESARWRAILAHELAHLRRRDHWVRRLELVAGLVWWWNPLYWLTLRNLDHEAELSCDAWVLWASPGDRLSYAESLIRICSALSLTGTAAPSLGIAGTGPSFERRLMMILNERVNCRASTSSILAALFLAVLALPSWTLADAAKTQVEPVVLPVSPASPAPMPVVAPLPVPAPLPALIPLPALVPLPALASIAEVVINLDDDDDVKAKSKADAVAKKEAERAALQKKMETLGAEMEQKFGPGSEFAKKMEVLGEEMGRKFGPGSEFAKKMEALGAEMAEKFGPDSDFAKDLIEALGPDSDFAKQLKGLIHDEKSSNDDDAKTARDEAKKAKEKAEDKAKLAAKKASDQKRKAKMASEDMAKKANDEAKKARAKADVARAAKKPEIDKKRRESRIDALQSRIEEMQKQLKQLKDESKDKDEDEEG